MPKLEDTLENIVQRTGQTFNLLDGESRNKFSTALRSDIASIVNQLNNVYKPLVSSLVQIDTVDALEKGMTGTTIYTDVDATLNSGNVFYDASLNRPRSIKESFDVLLTEIASLTIEAVVTSTGQEILAATAPLNANILTNRNNLKQLRLDTVGPNYTFDNDGAADLTYPLGQHIDAMGAFFANYPGTGLGTYSNAYPSLALNILLSQITIDTTLAQTVITDLPTHLAAIRTFIGMGTVSETPTYSDHGAITYVSDAMSLEQAIQTLDQNVASGGSSFLTSGNVTSNSPGTLATDDLVFGSSQLDDDGNTSHDYRLLFDKSKGAFRAGFATGSQWDDANRGTGSAAFGGNITAAGSYTFGTGESHTLDVDSADSACVGGVSNTQSTSVRSVIFGGTLNSFDSCEDSGIIACTNVDLTNSLHTLVGASENCTAGGNSEYITILSGEDVDHSLSSQAGCILTGARTETYIHRSISMGGGDYPNDTSNVRAQTQKSEVVLMAQWTAGTEDLTTDGIAAGGGFFENTLHIPADSAAIVTLEWVALSHDGVSTSTAVSGVSRALVRRLGSAAVTIDAYGVAEHNISGSGADGTVLPNGGAGAITWTVGSTNGYFHPTIALGFSDGATVTGLARIVQTRNDGWAA